MREEEIAMLIIGMWFGAPIGWFMKTALTWRRDAKRLAAETKASAPQAPPPEPAVSPGVESRLERLVDRVNQRIEGIEDRLEFTERLIETRRPAIRAGSIASDGE